MQASSSESIVITVIEWHRKKSIHHSWISAMPSKKPLNPCASTGHTNTFKTFMLLEELNNVYGGPCLCVWSFTLSSAYEQSDLLPVQTRPQHLPYRCPGSDPTRSHGSSKRIIMAIFPLPPIARTTISMFFFLSLLLFCCTSNSTMTYSRSTQSKSGDHHSETLQWISFAVCDVITREAHRSSCSVCASVCASVCPMQGQGVNALL